MGALEYNPLKLDHKKGLALLQVSRIGSIYGALNNYGTDLNFKLIE
jgi:hypothetical protein